ncbi:response regulator [Megalodesulfovibrio gigas]|uniref:Putative response regulator receiver protein n=1 Tax=Megalodesulfovibrio gigas (strain ATCC 19364 / DSM 1382 / NCIMB 9332 / VKM B-1759) TaxID=1121448 RepID=T2GF11_MEGG1|nr:response regulator [Megalodesulfovibrio gigas]AGW14759.1 putative response regulator receiver protein [Megalodesulfovibrio gigas DSM 1382 = ATCC 19364]
MDTTRVLLVDDEQDFLDLMQKRMAKRKIDLHVASSGQEALDLIRNSFFNVVILDVKMPGMDGIETLRQLRILSPDTQVIMLTGHADVETAVKGMELGAFDYMMKPMSFDYLLMKIQEANSMRSIGGM